MTLANKQNHLEVNPENAWRTQDGLHVQDLMLAVETQRVDLKVGKGAILKIFPAQFQLMQTPADDFLYGLEVVGLLAVDGEFSAFGSTLPRAYRIVGSLDAAIAAGFPIIRADGQHAAIPIGGHA
jgi:hypothetical protein